MVGAGCSPVGKADRLSTEISQCDAVETMNELRRMAYLDAIGIDSYVSRTQLPGAAQTRRLAIVSNASPAVARISNDPPATENVPTLRDTRSALSRSAATDEPTETAPLAPKQGKQQVTSVPRFSLAAIIAGDWLWLEALEGMPLTTDQVWLVKAMAQALDLSAHNGKTSAADDVRPAAAAPQVSQFDWPIHTNAQLDLGKEAAQAGVAGYIGRKLQQHNCRGLVLLGQASGEWVPRDQLDIQCVSTLSSAEILARPSLKQQVWRDLRRMVLT
jgi:hypothetical protein